MYGSSNYDGDKFTLGVIIKVNSIKYYNLKIYGSIVFIDLQQLPFFIINTISLIYSNLNTIIEQKKHN